MPDTSKRSIMRLVARRRRATKPTAECSFQRIDVSDHMVRESIEAHEGFGRRRSSPTFEYRKAYNTFALALGDSAALSLAFLVSGSMRWIVIGPPLMQWRIDLILPMWFVGAFFFRLYPGWGLGAVEELRRQTLAIFSVYAFSALLLFWSQWAGDTSRFAFTMSFLLSLFLVPAVRRLVKTVLIKSGHYGLPVVIYGAGDTGREVVKALRNEKGMGYIPMAFLDDHPAIWGERIDGIPVLGDTNLVLPEAPAAILAMPSVEREFQTHLLEGPLSYYRHVIIIPDLTELPSLWVRTFDLGGVLGLVIQCNLADPIARLTKRTFDLAFVALTAPLWIPLCLVISAAIWLEDRHSPLFLQERIGRRGRVFNTWKFRTMVMNADGVLSERLNEDPELKQEWEREFKLRKDPRITRTGRFLRETSLDEIPQLVNVLRGEMSLVGPRPLPAYHDAELNDRVQTLRRRVRPGITGLWQVSGRSDIGTTGIEQFDAYYVRNWSIWLDIVVLVRTFSAVVRSTGAY